jgi:hypothetical protein
MSKLDNIKAGQGYTTNVRNCANCASLKFDKLLPAWMLEVNQERGDDQYTAEKHGSEKNVRCGIGGFKIKKTATCNQWEAKSEK